MNESYKYLYSIKYDYHHQDLSKLESRQLFGHSDNSKVVFSDIQHSPSISAFIKNRLDIITRSKDYDAIMFKIEKLALKQDGFKVEYLALDDDSLEYRERIKRCRDIGFIIEGEPSYESPSIIYAITFHNGLWYFGILNKHNTDWLKHKSKPCSFSNSISVHIAKSLVSIVTRGNKSYSIIDACCGVGTIILEACYSNFNIEGCDINRKSANHSRENIRFFNYQSKIVNLDINQLSKHYDVGIIDLPYNLYTQSSNEIVQNIIKSTSLITSRVVIVSITDISTFIETEGLKIVDFCTVQKRGKTKFIRRIWVCEKE